MDATQRTALCGKVPGLKYGLDGVFFSTLAPVGLHMDGEYRGILMADMAWYGGYEYSSSTAPTPHYPWCMGLSGLCNDPRLGSCESQRDRRLVRSRSRSRNRDQSCKTRVSPQRNCIHDRLTSGNMFPAPIKSSRPCEVEIRIITK